MDNRGILHGDQGTLASARWRHNHWIVCVLSFKDRDRAVLYAASPERWRSGGQTIMNAQGYGEDGMETIHLIAHVKSALQFTDNGLLDQA